MMESFDAILFDNDGVLVDTEPLFLQATQELLATIDIRLTAEDYHDISMRQGRSVFDLAKDRGVSDSEIFDLRARRGDRYSELIEEGIAVLDGVEESLERLHGTIPMAIVTSSDRDHFDRIHRQTDLMRFFEFVIAKGDYSDHKPHPSPYLAAAKRLAIDPRRCLAIEDTERGLISATSAEMSCVVIPNALSNRGNFDSAHSVFTSMSELVPFLGLTKHRR
jgi:HAD superfamily hydrolase (TIGR01509 family)